MSSKQLHEAKAAVLGAILLCTQEQNACRYYTGKQARAYLSCRLEARKSVGMVLRQRSAALVAKSRALPPPAIFHRMLARGGEASVLRCGVQRAQLRPRLAWQALLCEVQRGLAHVLLRVPVQLHV
jgi:hypothetical protein